MPIEIGIWRLGEKLQRVNFSTIASESKLESAICGNLSLIAPQLLLVGRQVPTAFGKYIDVLAIDPDGNLTLIELKKDRTPREVVAQLLDYATWIQNLSYNDVAEIYSSKNPGQSLQQGFAEAFGISLPEKVNQSHNMIVVASELDPASERIISYLSDSYGVPINAVFFRYFEENGSEYLTRSWLADPQDVEVKASKAKSNRDQEPWNGRDFYVSFGTGESDGSEFVRSWDDARRFGFISGGGGKWYIQTLSLLSPGARVFVNIPGTGYVGVGTVSEEVCPISEFEVLLNGKKTLLLEAGLQSKGLDRLLNDPEKCEHVVRVDWIKTVPTNLAYWEKGMFAVQHTACRMRSSFTIQRLCEHFEIED